MSKRKAPGSSKSIGKRQRVATPRRALTGINVARAFKRIINHGSISSSSVSGVAGALTYRLSDIPGASEFTSLFDQYRIKTVEVHFIPDTNMAFLSSAQDTMARSLLFTVPDYDDSAAPTLASMLEREGTQFVPCRQMHKRKFTPRCQSAAWQLGGANGVMIAPSGQWIDCGTPDVYHYGLKYFLEAIVPTGGHVEYRILSYVTFELRGVR